MFLNSWSLALCLISLLALFLLGMAAKTGIGVLRFWDPDSDSTRQIRLESETWLASSLIQYALGFQVFSLVVFLLAADYYCQVIVGAMCATGALLANSYGLPALFVKIFGVFFYGFWIVLHKLDISSETYPLVRVKYIYLLALFPLIFLDIILQSLYIAGLSPDIITSCCGVVFDQASESSPNLINSFPQNTLLTIYYGSAVGLFILGFFLLKHTQLYLYLAFASGWVFFFCLAVLAVITVFSSYIYAMPFHNCPFCILKSEYNYFGFALYVVLLIGGFFGSSTAVVPFFRGDGSIKQASEVFQRTAVKISMIFLLFFVCLSSYHIVVYRLVGGES